MFICVSGSVLSSKPASLDNRDPADTRFRPCLSVPAHVTKTFRLQAVGVPGGDTIDGCHKLGSVGRLCKSQRFLHRCLGFFYVRWSKTPAICLKCWYWGIPPWAQIIRIAMPGYYTQVDPKPKKNSQPTDILIITSRLCWRIVIPLWSSRTNLGTHDMTSFGLNLTALSPIIHGDKWLLQSIDIVPFQHVWPSKGWPCWPGRFP